MDDIKTNKFLYLDMQFFWNENSELEMKVYRKPNQCLKYLEMKSTHAPYTFAMIPHSIFRCLA